METLEAIISRRSVRRYKEKKVPKDMVTKVLEAARWAPSSKNSQPWSFIILEDEKVRRNVAETTTHGKFLANAPVGVVVVVDPKLSNHPVEDGAAATQNMLLAAHTLGLGACWIAAHGSPYEEKLKNILGVPKDKTILSIISIGFPAESPKTTRKNLGSMVHIDMYGHVVYPLNAGLVSQMANRG